MTKTHHLLPETPCRSVLVLSFNGVTLSDIAGPSDVFQIANDHLARGEPPKYRTSVVSMRGGPVRTSCGITIATESIRSFDIRAIDVLMVPGGAPPEDPPMPADVVEWLKVHGGAVPRVCAICTGSFLVAEAGLAKGMRLTTHWNASDVLAARYPDIQVEHEPVFVRDGRLWSSAGFSAGIDLALALLEEDWGYTAAIDVARLLVVFLKRPGDQPQQSQALSIQGAGDREFGKLHAWMVGNLSEAMTVEVLAARLGMSPRTFARHYVEKVGRTPAKTVEAFRLEAAARRIGEAHVSLKQIARECGFGDEQKLRRAYARQYGVLPRAKAKSNG
ncbi:DJ-1/PfpI family protein [Cupriavidus basilensis]|uniref:DJ-1/PfpI family protein n=1 Tax=Cupriavidus basilensis TaxID=68895 RepID=A0ABT6AG57_9BURK|nr:DJ-1/PfpI family protein [Cupriavidus basilensis]MDF3831589.1 DJ-1/PfpI family protein [Cupriavidus basilensis]